MKPTIRNKLTAGFSGVLLLMATVAGIGIYALFSLRHSAQDATRIGGQLNALALEIQVHNLEAQRRIKGYLADVKTVGAERAREMYLDEAAFEINEIGTLADRAVKIAPDAEKRAKFNKIVLSAAVYEKALSRAVDAVEKNKPEAEALAANVAYDASAEQLHENAEDGEAEGRDAAQTSQDDITRTSQRAVWLSIGISLFGLALGMTMSYTLARAYTHPCRPSEAGGGRCEHGKSRGQRAPLFGRRDRRSGRFILANGGGREVLPAGNGRHGDQRGGTGAVKPYDRLLQVAKLYLGPAAESFLERQAEVGLRMDISAVSAANFKEFAAWVEVAAIRFIEPAKAKAMARQIGALGTCKFP